MQVIMAMAERVIHEFNKQDVVQSMSIFPINQDGRQVTCFTDININNAELYDYNILKEGGDHLLIRCWHSPLHRHPKSHLRKDIVASNGVYDCKQCDFCLFYAAGYNLLLTIDPSSSESINSLEPMIQKIESELNAPICNVRLSKNGDIEQVDRKSPIYERRVRPCLKPYNITGIMKVCHSENAKREANKILKQE